MSLAEIVSLESESEGIRQTAGTIISRNLFNMTEDGTQFKWRTYQPQATQQIKALLLHALGSDKELAKRAASDAISKIAAIELPNGKWNELLPALLNVAADTTPKNRKTAIMALGFICIQFKQHKIGITHKQT